MDLLSRPAPAADSRIPWGSDPSQFGDLWLPHPATGALAPLVVFFHGGWWQSEYDLTYTSHLCAALKREGIAVWSVEYRRVGETGGGFPATFQDAATGFDYASTLAKQYPLDLSRVVAAGHSAGGHLAFWIAGRHHLEPSGLLYEPRPQVPLHGVIALAGAVDLRLVIDLSGFFTFAHDRNLVYSLMGGTPKNYPDRYRAGNPGDLLPFHIPQHLLQGTQDSQIPPDLPARWAANARRAGDSPTVTILPSASHFDVVDPESPAWPTVREAFKKMILT